MMPEWEPWERAQMDKAEQKHKDAGRKTILDALENHDLHIAVWKAIKAGDEYVFLVDVELALKAAAKHLRENQS